MRLAPLLLSFVALHAAAAPPPKLKDAIARGRALVKKADYAGAVKAFQEGLAVAPDDPTALSELGLAAFKANDLPLAESASRRSVAAATSPALRAASLYNLGRVQEARGEKAAAIDSYGRSLKDRPNKTVRERLLALDPKAAAALDPVSPQPMEGPFASLAEYCKKSELRDNCVGDNEPDGRQAKFACDPASIDKKAVKGIVVFQSTCAEDSPDVTFTAFHLGYQVGGKWWVLPALEEMLDSMRQTDTGEVLSIESKDVVRGGTPEILVKTETTFDYRGMSSGRSVHLRVLGIGPSGKPSATGPILLEQSNDESDEEGNELSSTSATLEVVFLPDGLELKGRKVGGAIDKETLGTLLGKHPLAFP